MAVKKATDTIPIVMLNIGDPVGLGLVASLARPGGNVTGLSYSVGLETFGKGLELLKEIISNLRVVAVHSNSANPAHGLAIENIEIAARNLGIQLYPVDVRGPGEFDSAFAAMAKERVGAIMIMPDVLSVGHADRLAELARKNQLPSMHAFRVQVEAGGLISYGPSFLNPGAAAATFVDKLLKGAKPGELPVEQPTKFELTIT